MFRGGFFTLLAPMETRKNTLSGNYKVCNFTTIVSTLPEKIDAQRHQRQQRVQVNCF